MPKGIYTRDEEYRRNISSKLKGIPKSEETRQKMRIARLGKTFSKKEKIKKQIKKSYKRSEYKTIGSPAYRSLHRWVEKQLGKPYICSICKNDNLSFRSYQWANISGEYFKDVRDWIRLCKTCHTHYDLGYITIEEELLVEIVKTYENQ